MPFKKLIFFCLHTVMNLRLFPASNTTEEACFQSIPTISIVDHCPKDFSEWMIAKDIKQCYWISQKCTKPERFEYHCLPDRYHKQFIEVCAPTKWIVGMNCPFYDMEKTSSNQTTITNAKASVHSTTVRVPYMSIQDVSKECRRRLLRMLKGIIKNVHVTNQCTFF